MPLSGADQQYVQNMVNSATPEQRQQMRADAENTLAEVNVLMGQQILSRDENKASELAIEVLVRIEAREKGKGWLFRTKRRLQLVQMYLGR